MKKIYLFIAALTVTLGFSSCEKQLETESLSADNLEYLCSNPTDTRKMIDHVYSYFCEDTYTSRMSTNWMQNTDVEVGFLTKANTDEATRRGVWALNPRQFSDIKNCWDNSFKAIDFANQCIEGIENSPMYQSGDKDMKQLHGEAYCLRAYWYFLMCNFWADVPFATKATTKDNYQDTGGRVDKNIIYSHCIQDLIDVEEEMQWSSNVSVERMNREFALGFIVKLAMFRAGYSMQANGTMARSTQTGDEYSVIYTDENGDVQTAVAADDYYKVAKAYALKLISLRDRALNTNFKQIFDNEINSCNPANGDVLFEMGFVPNSGGDIGWCHGLSVVSSTKGAGTTYTNLTPSYACSFDPQDQRLPVTCVNYRWLYDNKQGACDALSVQPAKWCRMDLNVTNVESKGTGINWPVLRYADVLLLLAEADNEINKAPTALAKQMLARVRGRAFIHASNQNEQVVQYIDALNTYESFKEAIINERAWEFGGENIRKFDLVRWNNYADKVVDAIEWIRDVAVNYAQVKIVGNEFIYDKNQEIEPMDVANRLYYNYTNGKLEFVNDYFTYCDPKESPYSTASTLPAADIENPGATFDGLKYVNFVGALMSVSDTDPETKQKYGTDGEGNVIKKGVFNERIRYSWVGITDGVLDNGTEDLSSLRTKVAPYVIPIPTDRVMSSNGVLSNDGYAIRNK